MVSALQRRSGVHFLRSAPVAHALVASAGVGPGDLAFDLGAGRGAITAPLAATGARVIAVERNPRFVAALRDRFADAANVRVVPGDLRAVALPRNRFTVVASIPFAVATPALRRLFDPPRPGCAAADLIVEWGHARRLVTPRPRDPATAWWAVRYRFTLRATVPARHFHPAPAVNAAHLVIRRRAGPASPDVLRQLLRLAYGPDRTVRAVLPADALCRAGLSRGARTSTLTADQLALLGRFLSGR